MACVAKCVHARYSKHRCKLASECRDELEYMVERSLSKAMQEQESGIATPQTVTG